MSASFYLRIDGINITKIPKYTIMWENLGLPAEAVIALLDAYVAKIKEQYKNNMIGDI
ncbi:hypothetical protein ACFL1B_04135 [Nanoarchaeota archaeon]